MIEGEQMEYTNRISYSQEQMLQSLEGALDRLNTFRYDSSFRRILDDRFTDKLDKWLGDIRKQKDNPFTVVVIGDFTNAFRWGYAENIPLEIIEYGDPDGQGDLKRQNQIELRSEAYIGWGILDARSFVRVVDTVTAGETA